MSDVPFHNTIMGRQFYDGSVPEIMKALKQINANLERIAVALEKQGCQSNMLTEDN